MSTPSSPTTPTHYTILHLPHPLSPPTTTTTTTPPLSREDVKAAYHRALLHHHPDKARTLDLSNSTSIATATPSAANTPTHTIDQIISAYETLRDPAKRAAYDQTLALGAGEQGSNEKGTHLGVETFDLEDLQYDEGAASWRRNCRCGNDLGYVVVEVELERESQHGEIYVGCRGCSLFIKVLFGVADEEAT